MNTTCRLEGTPDGAPALLTEPAFPLLGFVGPIQLVAPPDGSDRLFVVEQGGKIWTFPNRDDADTAKLFLDVSSRICINPTRPSPGCASEEGLLSLVFHPQYEEKGEFFVYYTRGTTSTLQLPSVIARYHVSASDPDQADFDSEEVLLEVPQPYANHNGGTLLFGPDGHLYLSTGDGGSGGDPHDNGQSLTTLLGKVLRIDVDRSTDELPYAIPADNPFVGAGGGVREEIWAYGLRNPWRCSFDRLLGTLWCGDVGQGQIEEVDVVTRGGNYGWRRMEGNQCYNPGTGCEDPSFIPPVATYTHANGCSITGGAVYRGSRLPELYGAYVYGDFCTGRVWALRWDGSRVTVPPVEIASTSSLSSFGEDAAGEVYLLDRSRGQIRRFGRRPADPVPTFPTRLSETGCYADVATREPAAGLIPYEVNGQLWSDGLDKRRFIALPADGTIGYRDVGAWDFPTGTVLVKEFLLEAEKGSAARRPLETRFLVKDDEGWSGFTYQWNDEQTEGFLLPGSNRRTYQVVDPADPSNPLTFEHYFPSRFDCARCHNVAAGGPLGLHTGQLNRLHDYAGVVDNQLRAMDHVGLFEPALPNLPGSLPRFADPDDAGAGLEARARSYLQANCAHCHQPGGGTPAAIDLRFETSLADAGVCDALPNLGDFGIPDARLLAPGDPDRSVLLHRTAQRGVGTGQMPPLATGLVDAGALDLLRSWVTGLSSCP